MVLGRGQVLSHEFALRNPTDRPIRLLKVTPFTPCCSSAVAAPEVIPPGGSVKLAVTLKTEGIRGRKRVEFLVEADPAGVLANRYAATATVSPEVDVTITPDSSGSLLVGQAGRQDLEVVSRRVGAEGRDAPGSIEANAPLTARFVGKPVVATFANGLIEATRHAEVVIPADSAAPGSRRAEVMLRWPDGRSDRRVLTWEVRPRVSASPDGLVIKAGAGRTTRAVFLRVADDRPFRVVDLEGASLPGGAGSLPTPSTARHQLDLTIDNPAEPGTSEIRLTTDHLDQAVVTISVLAMSVQKGGGE